MKILIFFTQLFLIQFSFAQSISQNVGDEFQGGIVFYNDGSKILIVSKSNLPEEVIWEMGIYLCEKLEIDGFNDWKMPDNREALLLFKAYVSNEKIKSIFKKETAYIWTSSEGQPSNGKNTAYAQSLSSGGQILIEGRDEKKNDVRPIRIFVLN